MSQQPPVKPPSAVSPPKSEKSVRIRLGSDESVEGEALAQCSDNEWEQSESAYSADLLNVKKKPNRVTVFAAPEKMVDATGRSMRPTQMRTVQVPGETDERVKGLSRLVAGVAKILLDEDANGVEVTVSLKMNRQDKQNIK